MKMSSYIVARATCKEGQDEYGRAGFFLEPSWSFYTGDLQSSAVAAGHVMAKILDNDFLDFGEQVDIASLFLEMLNDKNPRLIRAMKTALRQMTDDEEE